MTTGVIVLLVATGLAVAVVGGRPADRHPMAEGRDMWRTRKDGRIEELADIGLFSECSRRELERVARLVTPVIVGRGRVLATEGWPAREVIVLVEGMAVATIGGEEVMTLGPGSTIGADALLDGQRHVATLTARSRMLTMVLTPAEFGSLLTDCGPSIPRRLTAGLDRRPQLSAAGASPDGETGARRHARLAS